MAPKSYAGLIGPIAGGAAVALMVFGALWWFARPTDHAARVDALAQQAAAASGQARAHEGFTAATPCRGNPEERAQEALALLRSGAVQSGLTVSALSLVEPAAQPPPGFVSAAWSMAVGGEEAEFTQFLKAAAAARIPVFVDRVEMRPSPNGLDAALEGVVLCQRG